MRVLTVIHALTHYRLMAPYIQRMHEKGVQQDIILTKSELQSIIPEIKQWGNIHTEFSINTTHYTTSSTPSRTTHAIKKIPGIKLLLILKNIVAFTTFLKQQERSAKQWLQKLKPDFVLLSAERYIDLELALAKCCAQRAIPTAVVGIDYFYVESYEPYAKTGRIPIAHSHGFDKLTAKLFPSQTFHTYEHTYLFFSAPLIWAMYFTGNLLKRPQLIGSTFVSLVCLDMDLTYQHYIREGIPKQNLRITGLIEHDTLYASRANKPETSSQRHIIIGIPQLYEHGLMNQTDHHKEIRFLIQSLATQKNIRITASLHPKMNPNDYAYLTQEYGITIAEKSLKEILGTADLYMATYSSTILWAILLKIPVILVDFYQLGYNAYTHPGVTKFTDKSHFTQKLPGIIDCLPSSPHHFELPTTPTFDQFWEGVHHATTHS